MIRILMTRMKKKNKMMGTMMMRMMMVHVKGVVRSLVRMIR